MSERDETTIPAQAPTGTTPGARLARNMVFYTVLRLLMVVALTLLIIGIGRVAGVDVPVLVAAIFSVVVALPLSMILFTRLRAEINSDIAAVDSGRREKREDLRRRMDEA
ncbi:DUF4229 domain-containing protein [Dietzia sp. PP-33]|jgi:hypothetical protein|uniref:DUF4229 domain-containing protein n=1 Tax=Dietzia sp. PP-33 TaxID=2957500 RepID=UPI0029AEE541|nr:DUF4229 domain-containing protein [Dietzia sp. PP-33]MDX2359080.1 DUF4229 domain-containing protein [Dietzia sp. PP-33]